MKSVFFYKCRCRCQVYTSLLTVGLLSHLGTWRFWFIKLCYWEEMGNRWRWHTNTHISCLSQESSEAWWIGPTVLVWLWFLWGKQDSCSVVTCEQNILPNRMRLYVMVWNFICFFKVSVLVIPQFAVVYCSMFHFLKALESISSFTLIARNPDAYDCKLFWPLRRWNFYVDKLFMLFRCGPLYIFMIFW